MIYICLARGVVHIVSVNDIFKYY